MKEIFSEHGLDLRDWMVLLALDELGWGARTYECNRTVTGQLGGAAKSRNAGLAMPGRAFAPSGAFHLGRELLVTSAPSSIELAAGASFNAADQPPANLQADQFENRSTR